MGPAARGSGITCIFLGRFFCARKQAFFGTTKGLTTCHKNEFVQSRFLDGFLNCPIVQSRFLDGFLNCTIYK